MKKEILIYCFPPNMICLGSNLGTFSTFFPKKYFEKFRFYVSSNLMCLILSNDMIIDVIHDSVQNRQNMNQTGFKFDSEHHNDREAYFYFVEY